MPNVRQLVSRHQLMFYTIFLMGWLLELIAAPMRGAPSSYTTAALIGQIGLLFLIAYVAVHLPTIQRVSRVIHYLAPFWVTLVVILSYHVVSNSSWVSTELWAGLPYIYFWLNYFMTSQPRSRTSYLGAWTGMAMALGVFALMISLVPQTAHLIPVCTLIPVAILSFAFKGSHRLTIQRTAVRVTHKMMAVLTMFFVTGMGMSDVSRWPSHMSHLSSSISMFFALVFALAILTGLVLRRRRHLLAYVAAIFLTIALLGYVVPEPLIPASGLQILMLVGATLLEMWWSLTALSHHRESPDTLALYTAINIFAVAGGWAVPLLAGSRPSLFVMMVSILLLTVVSPILFGTTPNNPLKDIVPAVSTTTDDFFRSVGLTPQERRIVQLLLKGYSNQVIIKELYISINTLKTHLKNIYRKTDAKNRHELIAQIDLSHPDSTHIPATISRKSALFRE